MVIHKELIPQPKTGMKMGLMQGHLERPFHMSGEFFLKMEDARTGEILVEWNKKNLITLDAGILAARLFRDNREPNRGAYMLSIGTGATGSLLSPDLPDNRQRKLNSEIERKTFSATTFRNSLGVAVSYPTNILDFTTTFGESEAVGALNEMGILSPVSDNPSTTNPNPNNFPTYDVTLDITPYDVLINILNFSVISKPSTAILTIVWRLSF